MAFAVYLTHFEFRLKPSLIMYMQYSIGVSRAPTSQELARLRNRRPVYELYLRGDVDVC